MYIIIVILVFCGGMYLLFKYVRETKQNEIEVLEEDRTILPKRALMKPSELLKYLEYCMTNSKKYKIVFYYLNEEHYFSVDMYNEKYIYKYDDEIFQTMGDIINNALINKGRIANNHDLLTITSIINIDDNTEIDMTTEELLKAFIIDGTNPNYDLNKK